MFKSMIASIVSTNMSKQVKFFQDNERTLLNNENNFLF
ncbi:Uncharacterised protein [Malacoplasma iowae]|nr:Uncharacterised protein [Malacoplasma iowae]